MKYGKLAFASLKVFKQDLETYLNQALEELGLDKCNDHEDLEQALEAKREKVIKKVNHYFDSLKAELKQEGKANFTRDEESKILGDIALSIKELRHQLGQLQNDVNELKGRG